MCKAGWVLGVSIVIGAMALGEEMAFVGRRALLVRPENSWGWDSALLGALESKGIEVTWGEPSLLEDPKALAAFDLVATSIKRRFTPAQVEGLKAYLNDGGSYYGSWGGPMGCPELLAICGASRAFSVYIKEMTLLDGPLAEGVSERHLEFPEFVGHMKMGEGHAKKGYEVVAIEPTDGTVVAHDPDGHSLGVIRQVGKGRTAVLGFGPERPKAYFRRNRDGMVVLDNLLRWLLPQEREARSWSGSIQVNLPARAEVVSVSVDGAQIEKPEVKIYGSLKRIALDMSRVASGSSATIRVAYRPLGKARNVETVLHLPHGTLSALETPAKAAEFVASLNATMVQPLLRSSQGHAFYRGMPDDTPDKKTVAEYKGDWLAEFIDLCHPRGIKVVGGVYFDVRTPLKKYPEVARIGKDGKPAEKATVCFNNPKAQEHNLNTIRQLLDNYKLDGLILDDNFELDHNPCYCPYCKEQFHAYCAKHNAAYEDPATTTNAEITRLWEEYWLEASRVLAGNVRAIAAEHGIPAGGWVGPGMKSTHLAGAFDFLGGMVYTCPAWSVRGPLSVMGEHRYITLLWGLNRSPADLEAEVPEAIRAGSASVGFWVWMREGGTTKDEKRGYEIEEGGFEAIGRALGRAEADWFEFYRQNIVTGDARFVVTSARLGPEELVLTVKNLGKRAERRVEGAVDLKAIE